MSPPGLLDDPDLLRWLGGTDPAWKLLDIENFRALRREPVGENGALILSVAPSLAELIPSAVCRNALVLLEAIAARDGLKLTETGNLARSVVEEMRHVIEWPYYDQEKVFELSRVVNEPDFMPLNFVRVLAQAARLVRPYRGRLVLTKRGNQVLVENRRAELQAALFRVAFWQLDLAYFGRGILGSWPQEHIGAVLWSLSISAIHWLSPEKLTRLCAIPMKEFLTERWDKGTIAMEMRVLQPLFWFGLLEVRPEEVKLPSVRTRFTYRKSPLFDRFLRFDIKLMSSGLARH